MREVIGGAIATELQDPRIGFVTVTAVETSPDLRSARVFVSVLGDEEEREATLAGLRSSHGVAPGRDRARDADQAHADPELPLRRQHRARRARALGAAGRVSRAGESPGARTERDATLAEIVAAIRDADRFLLTTHENPDGDALGSLLAMHRILDAARQGLGDVPRLEGVPAARSSTASCRSRRSSTRRRPTSSTASLVFLDCGNIDRMPVEWLQRDGARHPQHRPPPRQHPLRDAQPRRRRGLVHRRDRLRARARARRRAHAGDRRRPLRRPRHRHGAVHVREHDAALPPDGRRADRGGRGRRRHLPPPLRAGPDREAAADLARAREDRAHRRRRARDHLHDGGGLRGDRARARSSPRGSSTTCARSRAPRVAALVRDKTDGAGRAQGQPALDRRRRRRLARSRARRGAGGTPRAAGFSTDLAYPRAGRVPQCRRSGRSSSPGAAPQASILLVRQARRASRRTTSSPQVRRERGVKAGHAGTLDPFATGLLLVLLGRATRLQRYLLGAAEDLPRDRAARLDARRPRDPDGELDARPAACPDGLELPTGTIRAARADDLGGAGRGRAPLQARPSRRGGRDAACARSTVHRAELLDADDGARRATRSSARRAPTSGR